MDKTRCVHCARLDEIAERDPPEGTQFVTAQEYRELTGHWPSCSRRALERVENTKGGEG